MMCYNVITKAKRRIKMSEWLDRVETMKTLQRCVRCGEKDAYTMVGKQLCYECTEKGKEYAKVYHQNHLEQSKIKMKERYEKLKADGICVQCGKQKAFFGTKCKMCRAKFNKYQNKRLREGYYDGAGTRRKNKSVSETSVSTCEGT
jgi:ribosomal protein S14